MTSFSNAIVCYWDECIDVIQESFSLVLIIDNRNHFSWWAIRSQFKHPWKLVLDVNMSTKHYWVIYLLFSFSFFYQESLTRL